MSTEFHELRQTNYIETMVEPIRHKLIHFRDLGVFNRVLMGFMVAVFVGVTILSLVFPDTNLVLFIDDHSVPLNISLLLVLLMPLAISFLMVGALFLRSILGFVLVSSIYVIDYLLAAGLNQFSQATTNTMRVWVLYGVTHALLFAWGIFVILRHRPIAEYITKTHDANTPARLQQAGMNAVRRRRAHLYGWSIIVVFLLLAVFYGWLGWLYTDKQAAQAGLNTLTVILIIFSFGLIPMYILAGSDHAEIGEAIASRVNKFLTRPQSNRPKIQTWTLMLLTAIINVALLGYDRFFLHDTSFATDGWIIGPVFAIISAFFLMPIIRMGAFTQRPRVRIHKSILFLAMIETIVIILLDLPSHSRKLAALVAFLPWIIAIAIISLFILLVLISFFQAIRAVNNGNDTAAEGWGMVLVSVAYLFFGRWAKHREQQAQLDAEEKITLRSDFWINCVFVLLTSLTSYFAFSRVIGKAGVEAILAPGLLFLLILLFRQKKPEREGLAACYFILSCGLLILTIIFDVLLPHSLVSLGFIKILQVAHLPQSITQFVKVPSFLIIILALAWDLFTAGEILNRPKATNVGESTTIAAWEGRAATDLVLASATLPARKAQRIKESNDSLQFPHPSRCLLLTGYSLLALTVLTLLSNLDTLASENSIARSITSLNSGKSDGSDLASILLAHPFDHTPWILIGITTLGTTTLLTHFILDVGQWRNGFDEYQKLRKLPRWRTLFRRR